ncbi:pilus assembly protein [Massilia sp. PAMC28688]|uniref:TadE/TadG family type IV pilus assembly protein n=1 Tax=Massilia sp. PAMC28688 TaxID=2861283 RepID=UPI001C627419|nr:TadE family protein [Massilia sp. PAMC28688]QYF95028.1 pilus assembly protein [Massilia sp. PAMC28688]
MQRSRSPATSASQRGVAAVEFSFCAIVFFAFVCGVIELARALYMWSSMVEVTRRAGRGAAYSDFSNAAQMDEVRRRAMLEHISGGLPLRGNVSSANLKVDYLNASLVAIAPPSCPAQNYMNCNADPEGATCIRFVRVRLCAEGTACERVEYLPIIGAGFFPGMRLQFPTFATVTPAGSLGFQPGAGGNCM